MLGTFYDASDGPRIVIGGPSTAEFRALQSLFIKLATSAGLYIELHQQPFFIPFGGLKLTLACQHRQAPTIHSDGVHRLDPTRPQFKWQISPGDWDHVAALLNPFVIKPTVGHQYLAQSSTSDAIIVLSSGEYPDAIFAGRVGGEGSTPG